MRRSFSDRQFIVNDQGQPVGINLGYDHCAEHEYGIKELRQLLGHNVSKAPLGIEDRVAKITEQNQKYVFFKTYKIRIQNPKGSEKKTRTILAARLGVHEDYKGGYSYTDKLLEELNANPKYQQPWSKSKHELDGLMPKSDDSSEASKSMRIETDPFIEAKWGSDGFEVLVWGEQRVKALTAIHQALMNGRLAVGQTGSLNPFAGSGICLIMADEVPQETKQVIYDKDFEHIKLQEDFEATGIKEVLKKADKRYFALSPHRQEDGSLIFWLNPQEQRINNSGWFTLQDLQDWAQGKGKVIQTKAA